MRICVIFNPQAGKRRANRRLARFLDQWRSRVELWPTAFSGHGVELAKRAAESDFDVIVAAGGDGTAHDVANGILTVERRDVTFAVVPIGSANDYAFSVRKQFGTSVLDDETGFVVDVGLVQAGNARRRFFVECLGLGLNGRVTLESRKIHRLQGPLLYGLAAWRALRCNPVSEIQIQWDDQPPVKCSSMLLSILLGRREGAFQFAPRALLDDGQFNFVHAQGMGRFEAMCWLPRLFFFGPPDQHLKLQQGLCRSVRVQSATALTIHTDGEMFSSPEDAIQDVAMQIVPARLRVKVCPPG